jgi:exodeoxyribonuclease V gamma subunit
VAPHTRWLSGDIEHVFRPVAQPQAHELLTELLRLYRRGLCEPLPFFPRSSWALVDHDGSLAAARRTWAPRHDGRWSEGVDPWLSLALRGHPDPLGEDFVTLARAVLQPLREHLDERG